MQLTRLGVGGVRATYGIILDKEAATDAVSPATILTRIGVGGVDRYITVLDKSSDIIDSPSDLLTKIGIGGVGNFADVLDKDETADTIDQNALLTKLGIGGVGVYYKIEAKQVEVIVVPDPDVEGEAKKTKPSTGSGGGYYKSPISTYIEIDKKELSAKGNIDIEKILREDEEIISIIIAVVESGLI